MRRVLALVALISILSVWVDPAGAQEAGTPPPPISRAAQAETATKPASARSTSSARSTWKLTGLTGSVEVSAKVTAAGRVQILIDGAPAGSYQVAGTKSISAVGFAPSRRSVVTVVGAKTVTGLRVATGPAVPTVTGEVVRDLAGERWVAKGTNLTGTTWGYFTPYVGHQPDAFLGMAAWGMDTVRIQVNQNHWNSCRPGGYVQLVYRAYIDEQVQLALDAGLSPIVDLHTSGNGQGFCDETVVLRPMADVRSILFWETMVARWGHEPRVIFDLYNEPHDIPDTIWRDGGTYNGREYVGMQDLYDTVRAGGYRGPVLVSGNGWAHDITVLARYPLDGYGIIANHHLYGQDFTQLAINDFRPRGFNDGMKRELDRLLASVDGKYPTWVTEFGSSYFDSAQFNAGAVSYLESLELSWQVYVWGTRLPLDPADYDRYGILRTNGANAQPNPSGQPIYDVLAPRRVPV